MRGPETSICGFQCVETLTDLLGWNGLKAERNKSGIDRVLNRPKPRIKSVPCATSPSRTAGMARVGVVPVPFTGWLFQSRITVTCVSHGRREVMTKNTTAVA